MLTTKEVAETLKVTPKTVRTLIENGEITAYRIGRDFRISKEDLKSYISQSKVVKSEKDFQ